MTAPEANPARANWKTFIPSRDGRLIEDIELFKDFAVSVEKSAALNYLRVHDFASGS